ncbi:hypothetical protein B2904_orf2128 [Brachyspira pilosicoli B2904]|uniref:Uncharacterized protein n=1 Tax=Brachyspira pilosicoli B2904 TaxID=1133568 RepID=J9U0L5_BRAPL|nr:hypothetical protein [Brachyspira pilosicoli]AFR71457.1 hypothetical protein B2904_orf2128 [Brachyspira pilosicoli B2904]
MFMILEEIVKELEIILSDIAFSGIDNVDSLFVEKIELLEKKAMENKITNLSNLLNDFVSSIKDYKLEDSRENLQRVFINVSKLDFYIKNALY